MNDAGVGVLLELRSSGGDVNRLAVLAAELMHARVEVILAIAPAAVRAAREATASMPIVAMDLETDPLKSGFVHSLARPGGNVNGIFFDAPEVAGKWMQLLRDVVPTLQHVALLWDPSTGLAQIQAAESAARSLKIAAHRVEARKPADLVSAMRKAADPSLPI
jgi:putative ABC transport system substrate-binding protein